MNSGVGPNTKILTDKGYEVIKELEHKDVNVWNNNNFSKTIVKNTGENQKLLTVTLSNGSVIDCINDQNFYIYSGVYWLQTEVKAKDLVPGNQLIPFALPPQKYSKNFFGTYFDSDQPSVLIVKKFLEHKKDAKLHDIMLHLQTHGYYSSVFKHVPGMNLDKDFLSIFDTTYLKYENGIVIIWANHQRYEIRINHRYHPNIYVVSVVDKGIVSDTYSFTSPTHKGMFEGILLGTD
jgi:hypothetical protein